MENLQAYGEFARVYDMFQDNVDYDVWGAWLKQQLKEYGILDGLVLDLGCGTGTMTELLAEAGYDMIGVDNSEEMLAEAMEKRVESGHDILYLLQDMQEFELYGTVRAVVSVCDSLNYITEEEELQHVFALVNNYLDPHGIFLFDMNTVYKYQTMIGDATIAENREKRIADKKALYEEKMAFGRYKIVRKKSNNRYGAIDSKAEERIPCKYLSVGIADNGRAFEREDNLFDIYNSDGSLISEGLTYY